MCVPELTPTQDLPADADLPPAARPVAPRRSRRRLITLRLPHRPRSAQQARAFVVRHARQWGFPPPLLSDIALAVGEAAANALEHGARAEAADPAAPEPCVTVSLSWDGETLEVGVRDCGPGFDPEVARARAPKTLLAERGRGLGLMSALMDRVHHVRHADGMEVRLEKRLPALFEDTTRLT
jgi:serine/threonine-protein kinase RsbW